MLELLKQDARAAEAAKAVVTYTRDLKDFKPDFAENPFVPPGILTPVQVLTNTSGVFTPVQIVLTNTGSIAIPGLNVTVIPPYDYSGAWVTAKGGASATPTANPTTGFLKSDVVCSSEDESYGHVSSQLGIFFKPAINGQIVFSAALPSLSAFWHAIGYAADAHSRGSIGLRAYRFLLDGTPDPAEAFKKTHYAALWDVEDDSEGEWIKSRTPTLSLSVDTDHFYDLWVYLRAKASAEGESLFYASGARAELNTVVTSMSVTFT